MQTEEQADRARRAREWPEVRKPPRVRNVRNFWIRTKVDGRKTVDETGPHDINGGFTTTITVRDKGQVAHALRVTGRYYDGHVTLSVYDNLGLLIFTHKTLR